MIKHKSTLAKLLAKENITVQYGNYSTAWFDIKDRVLGLPMWKDMGKDVADLLIGHEVGHALFTPFEGWHDSPEKLEGCPRTYINVIEDARIERHIKDAYVGLVSPMARGYKKLFDDGFFGTEFHDMDWDNVKLIDKINLKAKVGAHLDVPFNDEEIVYYDRAMKTETFDEVLQLVRDVLAYTKENQEELLTPPPAPEPNEEDENQDEQQENQGPGQSGHDDAQDSEEEKVEDKVPSSDSDEGQSPAGGKEAGSPQGSIDEDISQSDENFRKNESSLLDVDEKGEQKLVANDFSKDIKSKIVIPFKQLSKERQQSMSTLDSMDMERIDESIFKFKTYMKSIKKDVNFAVKEFEMRKAAYRYSRSQTARSGSIDVNRVWSYKTNDDIFARVTQLADAKNHGMVMVIDYSGSMANIMGNVMDQLLHLVTFCKAVNIPFEVYGFTSANTAFGGGYWEEGNDTSVQKDSELYHQSLSMPQLVTSKLNKTDYEKALLNMFLRYDLNSEDSRPWLERYIISKNEDYGSTPLNEALVMSHTILKNFKRNHNVDNMNFVVISDGETNGSSIVKDYDLKTKRVETRSGYYGTGGININIDNKIVNLKDSRRGGTASLLKNIQKTFDATTIGFFIADDRYSFKNKIGEAVGNEWIDTHELKPFNREYMKNKCITLKNTLGYDEFYVVKGKQLSTDVEEFEPKEDASKGQITMAFKRFSKSKKLNKTLLTNFGKAVAE
jgi:hypothetical protein